MEMSSWLHPQAALPLWKEYLISLRRVGGLLSQSKCDGKEKNTWWGQIMEGGHNILRH